MINKMGVASGSFFAEMTALERADTLKSFSEGQSRVLVSSELGARGHDFKLPVDCIIEHDMAENVVSFINRAGRTARNGLQG